MSPFRIFKLQTDGSPQFVEEAPTLEDAIERVEALAESGRASTSLKMRKQESECLLPQAANRISDEPFSPRSAPGFCAFLVDLAQQAAELRQIPGLLASTAP